MALVTCPSCQRRYSAGVDACPGCRHRTGQPVAPPAPSASEGERVFYEWSGGKITASRFVAGDRTFPMQAISSFRQAVTPPSHGFTVLLAMIGAGCLVGAFYAPGVLALAFFLGGVGFLYGTYVANKMNAPTYHVIVTAAGSELTALTTSEHGTAARILAALSDAVAHRG